MGNSGLNITKTPPYRKLLPLGVALLLFLGWCVSWYSQAPRLTVLVGSIVSGLLFTGVYLLSNSEQFHIEKYRLILCAGILYANCVVFALIVPPFAVPDETYHYRASYWLADCVAGESELIEPESIPFRLDDWNMYNNYGLGVNNKASSNSYNWILDHFSWTIQDKGTYYSDGAGFSVSNDNIFARFGSVLGILVAKSLGLGSYPLFYLGRLLSALFFVACVTCAYRIAPVGKQIFFSVAMLPMSLQLAASYSYDGGVMGLGFVFLALLLRLYFDSSQVSCFEAVALSVLAALFAVMKGVYIIAIFLILFIPNYKFKSRKYAIRYKVLTCVIALAFFSLVKLTLAAGISTGGALSESGEMTRYSLGYLLAHPLDALLILCRTLYIYLDTYVLSLVGQQLGHLQDSLSTMYILSFAYLAVMADVSQISETDSGVFSTKHRILFGFTVLLIWLAIHLTMLMLTPMGSQFIQGVQGRYLLPVLPLLHYAARTGRHVAKGCQERKAFVQLTYLNSAYVVIFLARVMCIAP